MDNYLEELQELLGDYKVPKIIKKLVKFEKKLGDKYYTPDFELYTEDILDIFFEANDLDEDDIEYLLEHLIEFARADDTGGIYVIWLKDDIKDVAEMPIIWFGSEGEMELVASNFKDFLKRLTFVEEDYEAITELDTFKKWIKKEFDIDPVNNDADFDKIEQKAKDNFQEPLAKWLTKHGGVLYAYPDQVKWDDDLEKWVMK